VSQRDAERPDAVITLVYAGGLALAIGALTLGIDLLILG
jgi:hypothetical protein